MLGTLETNMRSLLCRGCHEIALSTVNTKRYRYLWKYTDDSVVVQGGPKLYDARVSQTTNSEYVTPKRPCTVGDGACRGVGGRATRIPRQMLQTLQTVVEKVRRLRAVLEAH